MSSPITNISSPHRTFVVVGICIAIALIASVIALLYGYHTWIAPQFLEDSVIRSTIAESELTANEIVEYGTTVKNKVDTGIETYQDTKETIEHATEEIQETTEAVVSFSAKLKNYFTNETETEATVTD